MQKPEPLPVDDPAEAIGLLVSGDLLYRTLLPGGEHWTFARCCRPCPAPVVLLLRCGGPLLEPYGGKLVALADGLFPELGSSLSQSFAWAAGGVH